MMIKNVQQYFIILMFAQSILRFLFIQIQRIQSNNYILMKTCNQYKASIRNTYNYYNNLVLHTLLVLIFCCQVNCQNNGQSIGQIITLSDKIFTGQCKIAYERGKQSYESYIFFPDAQKYHNAIFVKNIVDYVGQPPLSNCSEKGLNVWGYNFTLSSQSYHDFLIVKLLIDKRIKFSVFQVGYLISADPSFIVGETQTFIQKLTPGFKRVRNWPIEMIIKSPPKGTMFIPFITGLKANAPQPSVSFGQVSSQPMNQTHKILRVILMLYSSEAIEGISFSYISHAQGEDKYALAISQGYQPSKQEQNVIYGVIEVKGYTKADMKSSPQYFKNVGVSIRKSFYLEK